MHVHLVVVLEMGHQGRHVSHDRALRSSIRAVEWPERALRFVLQLAVVWKNPHTAKVLVFAGKFERGGDFLQSKASDVAKLVPASWASVVYTWLAPRTKGVAI